MSNGFYSCGLKMNRPLRLWVWDSTMRLIILLMPISILGVTLISHGILGLNWGAAILLGAILAPTDPVLASEVQLADLDDRDELRFGLTSEGGLNDALAFPFVYFGLNALNKPDLGSWLGQWFAVDLVWAIIAGIGMGFLIAKGVTWLSHRFQQARHSIDDSMEDFLALATILLAYSAAELIAGYGFVAVFVAGVTIRHQTADLEATVSQSEFIGRLEKLLEIGTILLVGSLLRLDLVDNFARDTAIVAGSLILIIRPVGAWVSTKRLWGRHKFRPITRLLFGWFGVRGVGSLYYLSYASSHGLTGITSTRLGWITYLTVVISVILHGITATPLINWYEHYLDRRLNSSSN
jgi:sodium/hydrogen antiporter